MTHRQESEGASARAVAVGRDIAARWCALAEQRLHHLSEMFETGRWRRYHSEVAFLENIQEAKRAVETWRALASGGDIARGIDSMTSVPGRSPSAAPPALSPDPTPQIVQPKAVHIAPDSAVPVALDPIHDILAEIIQSSAVPPAISTPAATVSFTAPVEASPLKAPAGRPVAALSEDDDEASEDVVEFTFNLDGLEAKYPLLRNAF